MTKSSRILTNVPLDDLKPYENNPRKNDMAVAKVAASLKEFTYAKVSVLVDENMTLLAGHTTLKAMRSLGWKTCPEVKQVFGWSEAEKRAYRIADNKLGELAEWDLELLAGELASLDEVGFDAGLTGFDDGEIGGLNTLDAAIGREPDTDRAGASPWERMGADAAAGVILTFGAITVRISSEVYNQFLARCEQEPSLAGFVEGVILDACSSP